MKHLDQNEVNNRAHHEPRSGSPNWASAFLMVLLVSIFTPGCFSGRGIETPHQVQSMTLTRVPCDAAETKPATPTNHVTADSIARDLEQQFSEAFRYRDVMASYLLAFKAGGG